MLFRLFTVIAVLALAISTWILTSPARHPKAPEAKQAELPSYYLKNAVMTDYDSEGNPSVRIEAERISQVAHGTQVALYNVKVDYQPADGQAWVMVGDTAEVETGAKVVTVQGNVKLQGEATGPKHVTPIIRTDRLTYDTTSSIVTTPGDVRLEFGTHTLIAHGLTANLKDQTMRLESKVNGRFHP